MAPVMASTGMAYPMLFVNHLHIFGSDGVQFSTWFGCFALLGGCGEVASWVSLSSGKLDGLPDSADAGLLL